MNIGSFDGIKPSDIAADLAAEMPQRIRSAHETAEQAGVEEARAVAAPRQEAEAVDSVGAELRTQLEEIVASVISGDDAPTDLLGEVVDVVVADRMERTNLPIDEGYQDAVAEQMRSDPTVVAELDDILQAIARDLAIG